MSVRPRLGAAFALIVVTLSTTSLTAQSLPVAVQVDAPTQLRVVTSMFGTYIRKGELLFYPFFEW